MASNLVSLIYDLSTVKSKYHDVGKLLVTQVCYLVNISTVNENLKGENILGIGIWVTFQSLKKEFGFMDQSKFHKTNTRTCVRIKN